jgi:hypothetical protein
MLSNASNHPQVMTSEQMGSPSDASLASVPAGLEADGYDPVRERQGTLVLHYGPEASTADADALITDHQTLTYLGPA